MPESAVRYRLRYSFCTTDEFSFYIETYRTKFYGTFGYRAPESMKNGTLSLKGDIYSYGILLYELVHQKKMYKLAGVEDDDEEEKVVDKLYESIKK